MISEEVIKHIEQNPGVSLKEVCEKFNLDDGRRTLLNIYAAMDNYNAKERKKKRSKK